MNFITRFLLLCLLGAVTANYEAANYPSIVVPSSHYGSNGEIIFVPSTPPHFPHPHPQPIKHVPYSTPVVAESAAVVQKLHSYVPSQSFPYPQPSYPYPGPPNVAILEVPKPIETSYEYKIPSSSVSPASKKPVTYPYPDYPTASTPTPPKPIGEYGPPYQWPKEAPEKTYETPIVSQYEYTVPFIHGSHSTVGSKFEYTIPKFPSFLPPESHATPQQNYDYPEEETAIVVSKFGNTIPESQSFIQSSTPEENYSTSSTVAPEESYEAPKGETPIPLVSTYEYTVPTSYSTPQETYDETSTVASKFGYVIPFHPESQSTAQKTPFIPEGIKVIIDDYSTPTSQKEYSAPTTEASTPVTYSTPQASVSQDETSTLVSKLDYKASEFHHGIYSTPQETYGVPKAPIVTKYEYTIPKINHGSYSTSQGPKEESSTAVSKFEYEIPQVQAVIHQESYSTPQESAPETTHKPLVSKYEYVLPFASTPASVVATESVSGGVITNYIALENQPEVPNVPSFDYEEIIGPAVSTYEYVVPETKFPNPSEVFHGIYQNHEDYAYQYAVPQSPVQLYIPNNEYFVPESQNGEAPNQVVYYVPCAYDYVYPPYPVESYQGNFGYAVPNYVMPHEVYGVPNES